LLQPGKFDWSQATVRVEATAVVSVASQEKGGISCTFRSLGSRLKASIKNGTDKDAILATIARMLFHYLRLIQGEMTRAISAWRTAV
jgi:hypothetical protein